MKERFLPAIKQELSTIKTLSSIAAAFLFLEVTLRLPKKARVEDFESLIEGTYEDAIYDPEKGEITVPFGGTACTTVNGVEILVKDFKPRPEVSHFGGALIQYGGQIMEEGRGGEMRYDMEGGQRISMHTPKEEREIGNTGIIAWHWRNPPKRNLL